MPRPGQHSSHLTSHKVPFPTGRCSLLPTAGEQQASLHAQNTNGYARSGTANGTGALHRDAATVRLAAPDARRPARPGCGAVLGQTDHCPTRTAHAFRRGARPGGAIFTGDEAVVAGAAELFISLFFSACSSKA